VIPRPDEGIHDKLVYVEIDSKKKPKKAEPAPTPVSESVVTETEKPEEPNPGPIDQSALPKIEDLGSLTVEELRRIARRIDWLPIHGREISRANKEELIEYLKEAIVQSQQ
jgi:ethanolamine utilization protein EutM